jgi:hypothetical protein
LNVAAEAATFNDHLRDGFQLLTSETVAETKKHFLKKGRN